MKKLALPAALLVAAGGFAWWFWPESETGESWLTGNVEMTTIDISFPATGKLLELIPREGERVLAGSLLGQMEATQLLATRAQTQARREAVQARIGEAEARIRFQQESLRSGLAEARAERNRIAAQLAELQAGSRVEEIAQAAASKEDAEVALGLARRDEERIESLFASGDVSRQQWDQTVARRKQAEARVEQAREALELLQGGPRREQITAAQEALQAGEARIAQVRAGQNEIQRLEKSRLALLAEMQAVDAELVRLQAALQDLTALAPLDAQVFNRTAEPGEVVPAGKPVLRLADTRRPWINLYIPESDLGRVQLGMPAEIRSDSYPHKLYRGRVAFIAEEAEFTPKQIQTRELRVQWVYRVKIEVENPEGELKLNMPVDARLLYNRGAGL